MNSINSSNINLNKLGIFGKIEKQGNDDGCATLQLTEKGLHKVGGDYNCLNIPGRWFRFKANKDANNAIRTKLLENLGAALGISGVNRNNATGVVTFSKDFMDQLEQTLGKDVLLRSNFGIGKDGQVGSGSPLTERRITAIVNRVRQLAGVPEAEKKMNVLGNTLLSMMTESHIELKGGHSLSAVETAKFVKAFKAAGGKMDAIDTVAKLKAMIEGSVGRGCQIICDDKKEAETVLQAPLNNTQIFQTFIEASNPRKDELKDAANLLIKASIIKRTDLKNAVENQPPTAADLREGLDFSTADIVVGEDNLADIRKKPTGKGTVIAHYPDDIDDVRNVLEDKYANAESNKTNMSQMKLFLNRGYIYEINGKEFDSNTVTPEDLEVELEKFFGNHKLANTLDALFGGYLSLSQPHTEKAEDGLSISSGAATAKISQQKLSLRRNNDGSIQITSQIYAKNPSTATQIVPAIENGKKGPKKTLAALEYKRPENDPEDSFFSSQLVFTVKTGQNGIEVEGVGEHPSSIKFKYSDNYKVNPSLLSDDITII